MKLSNAYNKATLIKCLFFLVATAGLQMATGGNFAAVFPLIAVMALMSNRPEWIVFTILLFIATTVGNAFFMRKGLVFGIAERAALLLLAFMGTTKAAGRAKSKFVTPFLGMMLYIAWMCISSAGGWSPLVSYLKLLLFTSIYFAFYASANLVITDNRTDDTLLRAMVLSITCFFIIGSFCLIPFPAIGMMGFDDFTASELASGAFHLSLFKGMTMHSQSLGPIVAVTSVLLYADLAFSIKKWDPLYVCMLLMAPVLIYKTSSRTAMGSYIAGMGIVTLLLMKARGVGSRWKGKVLNVIFAIVIFCSTALLALPSGREKMMTFLFKFRQAEAGESINLEDITVTRKGLVDSAMINFRKKPVHGNGFQVGEDMEGQARSGLASYLTAPVEKGVWTTAVLEEGGAVGFGIFIIFILAVIVKLNKIKAYIALSCFSVLLVSNLGEFTMFSMSYTGGYMWCLIFAGVAMDAQRNKLNKSQAMGWNFRVR